MQSEVIFLADVRRVEVQAEDRQRVTLTTGEPGEIAALRLRLAVRRVLRGPELPAMLELSGETVIVESVFKTLADGTPLTHKGPIARLPVAGRSYIFFARLEDGRVKLRNEMTESPSYIESCLAHMAPADSPDDLDEEPEAFPLALFDMVLPASSGYLVSMDCATRVSGRLATLVGMKALTKRLKAWEGQGRTDLPLVALTGHGALSSNSVVNHGARYWLSTKPREALQGMTDSLGLPEYPNARCDLLAALMILGDPNLRSLLCFVSAGLEECRGLEELEECE